MFKTSLLALALAMAGVASAKPAEYVPREVLVGFKPGTELLTYAATARLGAQVVKRLNTLEILQIKLPATVTEAAAIQRFQELPFVTFAEYNGIYRTTIIPNDTRYNEQWGLPNIRAPQGWDLERGSTSVIVAIIDTGIATAHSDVSSKVVSQRNIINGTNNAADDNGHGTHCAGIAAAVTNNSLGIAGVGWNIRLMAVKVLNSGGSGSWANVASGIDWARQNGAHVLSLSLGGTSGDNAVQTAVNNAWNANKVIVAAAGNNGSTQMFYPAAYVNCIAVASNDSSDRRSSFSNYGTNWVDVTAPGQSILSTWPSNTYTYLDGTSMAAPHVAGLAALCWSRAGLSSTNTQIRGFIENNCDPTNGTYVAKGRINCFRALQAISTPREFQPWFVQTTQGTWISGDVNSLINSDDNRYVVRQRATVSPAVPNAQIVVAGTADNAPINGMTVRVEAHCSGSPSSAIIYRVDGFNYTNQQWETVFQGQPTSTDSVINIAISGNPSRFVEQSSRDIQFRVNWFDRGALNVSWEGRTDQIRWLVN